LKDRQRAPALSPRRRRLSLIVIGCLLAGSTAAALGQPGAQERRYTVAFANLTEEPGVTLEGTGFTGREVRESFVLASRRLSIDLVFYDNQRDAARALANAEDAIARKVDLYVQYHRDEPSNAVIADRLKAAGIPVLAVNYPVPAAPLYTVDNLAAGRIAGDALGQFGTRAWRNLPLATVIIGALAAQDDRIPERVQGVMEGLRRHLPTARVIMLDTQGDPSRVAPLLGRVLAAQPSAKILIAATDDATALASKSVLEATGRLADAGIVSHGVDRSVHGGMNERKEIDPSNRGSVLIGSVAFFLDRYGYDILPLALRMLRGEGVPPRTTTRHILITAANVFVEYPPYDMN